MTHLATLKAPMTIILSRNEIRAETEKAIRGVGKTWGQAKDGGAMATWLAAHDVPFLGALTACLDRMDDGDDGGASSADCEAVIDGITLAEMVAGTGRAWSGTASKPRFLMAGMAIVASEQGCALTLKKGDQILAVANNGDVWMAGHDLTKDEADVTLSPGHDDAETLMPSALMPCRWSARTAHEVPAGCWAKLSAYAYRTYVPETEEKRRAGAGAGDIDNN